MANGTGFKHLTASDRDRIQALWGYGHTQKDTARVLGVSPATVSRELTRYGRRTWRDSSKRAEAKAGKKPPLPHRPGKRREANPALKGFIIAELQNLRSPDEIAGRLRAKNITPRVGTNALYKWLYSEDGKPYCRYLCTRRSRKKSQSRLTKRVLIPDRISFTERPTSLRLVHAEGDLFVSPRISKACGLLGVTKQEKLLSGSLIPNRTTRVVVPAMQDALALAHPDTCTLDNG